MVSFSTIITNTRGYKRVSTWWQSQRWVQIFVWAYPQNYTMTVRWAMGRPKCTLINHQGEFSTINYTYIRVSHQDGYVRIFVCLLTLLPTATALSLFFTLSSHPTNCASSPDHSVPNLQVTLCQRWHRSKATLLS